MACCSLTNLVVLSVASGTRCWLLIDFCKQVFIDWSRVDVRGASGVIEDGEGAVCGALEVLALELVVQMLALVIDLCCQTLLIGLRISLLILLE